jgi:2,4-dienoyl-CoA reductase-like NADH-dependent reductase (Old Yellow Enzyme family)
MEWSGQRSWIIDDAIKLARLLPATGVDLLDVSSGGNHFEQKIQIHSDYQVDLAAKIRQSLRADGVELLVGAVGLIKGADMANRVLQNGLANNQTGQGAEDVFTSKGWSEVDGRHFPKADLIFVGRQFLREPEFVLTSAEKLNVKVQWPLQYHKAM